VGGIDARFGKAMRACPALVASVLPFVLSSDAVSAHAGYCSPRESERSGPAIGEYEVPAPVEPDTCIDASAALMPTPGEMPAFVPNQSLRLLDLRG